MLYKTNKNKINKIKIIFFTVFLLIFFSYFLTNQIRSQEYDPDFAKGRIISNFQMFDYNSMNVFQIQSFLQSKNSYLASYVTPDYQDITKTAAEIIYDAAQRYQVNPKYILVTLQKEQGLIQMENPTQKRLDWAAGYAVCDSCSTDDPKIQKYKGFGKQVDNTAGAMRFYNDKSGVYEFIKKAGIPYNIDGEQIIFETQATANLYTYTPHIHGNYTFWRIWQRYFGDPLSSSREANASIYTGYMAQVIDTGEKIVNVNEGEKAYFWIEYLNIGTMPWINEDEKSLYLIDTKYKASIPIISQTSVFSLSTSTQKDIKVYSQKRIVNPGEVLRITIPVDPNYNKSEPHNYMLVYGGKGWFADSDASFNVVRKFRYEGEYQSGIDKSLELLKKYTFTIKYKNTGTMTWNKSDTKLQFIDLNGKMNYVSMTNTRVAPGQIASFVFSDIPKNVGDQEYKLSLYKVITSSKMNKFPAGDANIKVNISSKYGAKLLEKNVPSEMKPGEIRKVTLKFKNVGKEKWTKSLVLRAYSKISPFTRSGFYDSSWSSSYAIDEISGTINPGQDYTFTFNLKAPKTIAKYPLYLQLEWGNKYEEIVIDDTLSKKFIIDVKKDVVSGNTNSSAVVNTTRAASLVAVNMPESMKSGEIKEIALILKNTGTEKWDENTVLRSYKSLSPFSGSYFYDSSWISSMAISKIKGIVNPGEQYTFIFKLKAPITKKQYPVYFQLEYGSRYEEILIDNRKSRSFNISVI